MNVLFFTISAGEGHNQVADTLAEELLKSDKTNKVQVIDTFNYVNPKLHKIIMEGYIKSIKYLPELYGFFYKKTQESDSSLSEVSELLSKTFISRKILKLLNSFNPDIIICTHPFPSEALSILKKQGKIDIPIITTITDYTLHSAWLNKEINYYIIASESLKKELKLWQVPEEKCKFYGIPVRKAFYLRLDRNEICKELQIKNKFTVLIMGGGLGLGNITDALNNLVNYDLDLQIIVITGKNNDLYDNLSSKYRYIINTNRLKIYGYVSDIHKVMTVSDIIITKPGGLTLTEAITKELPIIVTSNLPGQEERNTEFILNNGIGMIATDGNALISAVNLLKNDKIKYSSIKSKMSKLKNSNSTNDIISLILSQDMNKCTIKA